MTEEQILEDCMRDAGLDKNMAHNLSYTLLDSFMLHSQELSQLANALVMYLQHIDSRV